MKLNYLLLDIDLKSTIQVSKNSPTTLTVNETQTMRGGGGGKVALERSILTFLIAAGSSIPLTREQHCKSVDIEWPPQSPDLTTLFFFCGAIVSVVYENNPQSLANFINILTIILIPQQLLP